MTFDTSWFWNWWFRYHRHHHHHHHFTIKVRQIHSAGVSMANGIIDGGSGTFQAVLDLNGTPLSKQPTFAWSSDVADATITPSTDTASAVISVPAGETATAITVTATATDPNGNTVSGSVNVPLNAPQVFTVTVSQTA